MQIEIVYTTKTSQNIIELEIPKNTTIKQALELIAASHSINPLDYPGVGIFGQLRSMDWQLKAGDRLELYRPLRVTPNQARLERAKLHKLKKKTKNKD